MGGKGDGWLVTDVGGRRVSIGGSSLVVWDVGRRLHSKNRPSHHEFMSFKK